MMLRSSSTPLLGSLLPNFSDSPNNNNNNNNTTPNNCHLLSEFPHHKPIISCNHLHSSSPSHSSSSFRRVRSESNLADFNKKKHPPPRLEAIPSFSNNLNSSDDEAEEDEFHQNPSNRFQIERTRMYLAAGLGLSTAAGINGGNGGGGNHRPPVSYYREEGGGGGSKIEEHYRKMVEGDPGNGMVLRNYGEYLERVKGDLEGAEEYYSRAILADPKDGEILSHYAKLVWELHHDQDRATRYFERAIQASQGQDSHVQAAYASFLWDVEEAEEEEETSIGAAAAPPVVFMASATA